MLTLKQTTRIFENVGYREPDLFIWLYDNLYTKLRLSSVSPEYEENLRLTKTKSAIFITLVDDIADNKEYRDKELIYALMDMPFKTCEHSIDSAYYHAAQMIWQDFILTIKKYPRYSEFRDILFFDFRLVMASQEYSMLINTNRHLPNIMENEIFGPHGTLFLIHASLDLMCSPEFDINDLGQLREILIIGQKIAQLCNTVNTYRRELEEEDISSPVVLKALLDNPKRSLSQVRNFKQIENQYERKVYNYINEMKRQAFNVRTVDVIALADVMNRIWLDYKSRKSFGRAITIKPDFETTHIEPVAAAF